MPKKILSEYLKKTLDTNYTKQAIDSIGHIQEEDGVDYYTTIHSNMDYIILVAKLETFTNIIDVLKEDENLVLIDKLEQEMDSFKQKITLSIEKNIQNFNNGNKGNEDIDF